MRDLLLFCNLLAVLGSDGIFFHIVRAGNKLGDSGAAALATALQGNATLTSINLFGLYFNLYLCLFESVPDRSYLPLAFFAPIDADLGEFGALSIASALKLNDTLISLDIGGS